jgi:hypothetical protein
MASGEALGIIVEREVGTNWGKRKFTVVDLEGKERARGGGEMKGESTLSNKQHNNVRYSTYSEPPA